MTPSNHKPSPPLFRLWAVLLGICVAGVQGAPSPELPGEEINESDYIRKKSKNKVTKPKEKKSQADQSWLSPGIDEQLARDKTLIGFGLGAIFVPSFTEPRLEPEIFVFDENKEMAASGMPAERILVEPGTYLVRMGSGILNTRMKYYVTVMEGHTSVVDPTWAGLVVETITEDADHIDQEYEIYRMDKFVTYGKGFGLEEERLDDQKTWILPPGLYKITKAGVDYNAFRDYITVQLNPGELTIVELIFDEDDNVIGGGVRDINTRRRAGTNWTYGARLGGNVSFTNTVQGEETENSVSTLMDFKIRAKYDNTLYLGINEFKSKSQFRWEEETFNPELDEAQLRSTWVRRLNAFIGPYIRGKISTHLVPENHFLGETDTLVVTNRSGEAVQTLLPGDEIEIRPSLMPTEFGEGVGVNLEILNTYNFELSSQVGGAARQIVTRDQYAVDLEARRLRPVDPENTFGIETNLISRLRLGSRFTVDFLAELFFENAIPKRYQFDDFSLEFRYSLTRNIELTYLFELNDKLQEIDDRWAHNRFEYLNNVLLRISWNI